MKKCCFTGHRPKSLPWGYDETKEICITFKNKLYNILEGVINDGYTYFINGLAEGFDTIALETLFELKNNGYNIIIEGAIPCKDQEIKWTEKSQNRYRENIKKLDKITYISDNYTDYCMQQRNDYMIDNSQLIVACYKGTFGGTKSTIKKAQNK